MHILDLPPELLQLTIDIAVLQTNLQCALRFQETCRYFKEIVQKSIFRLPKAVLLQTRLCASMTRGLVHSKMLLGNADKLLLCYTINRTAEYLTERITTVSRDRYVQILEASAASALMYWRLLDCLTTERPSFLPPDELRDNALIAAVGTKEAASVQKLLEEGANPASNTPLFGEPLATAALSGSLVMVCLLLKHWNWEDHAQFSGLRLAHAIEAAATAGHKSVLAKLLEYRDRIDRSLYDDTIVRTVKSSQTALVEPLLLARPVDFTPLATVGFWIRLVRTAAEYNRQSLLQRLLTDHPSDIGEASLVTAMEDACLENHGQVSQIILPRLSVVDPARHADSLFWAARFGNVKALEPLLTSLQNSRRALLLAFSGAISGRASEAIAHLCEVAGVSPVSKDAATRFTDVARLILVDTASVVSAEPLEPLSAPVQAQKLREAARTGSLADVINIFGTMQALHQSNTSGIAGAFSEAAKNSHLDVLLFLCENWKPHLVTSCAKSPAVAQIFFDFGWNIGQTDEGARHPRLGSFVQDEHFTRWLLDKGATADARGEFDVTAVSVAIVSASMSTIRLLLHRSSGIKQGQLLHFALQRRGNDTLEIIELLLNLGCPIDSVFFRDDPRSWLEWGVGEAGTALFTAAKQGRDDVVAYLLSRGADTTVVSNKDRTALQVAESKEHFGVIKLLRQ